MKFVLWAIYSLTLVFSSGINAELKVPWMDLETMNPILLAQGSNPVMDVKPLGDPITPPKEIYEPITDVLPIWGKRAKEKGYNLPLPFGVALNYIYLSQKIEFADVVVDLGGADSKIEGVTFEDPKRSDNIGVFRADAWIFPFLNLYGLFGYLEGNIKTGVSIPGSLTMSGDPKELNADIEYNGFTYGMGFDVAGGYDSFFFLLDSNFTWTDVDVSDTPITTFTFSPKIGILLEDKDLFGRGTIWIGGMYLNFDMTVSGSIATRKISSELPDILGTDTLNYSARIAPIGNWNMLIGGSWEITPRWLFLAEVGFIKRTQYIMGGIYRF